MHSASEASLIRVRSDSHDAYNTWSAYAEAGALSPYSRVSLDWVHGRTPIKPEIVFEAGNRALSPEGVELLSGVSSLSLLTTAKDFTDQPLTTFWATSAATAQAAGMAGRLMAHDPSWWPETVRALMVHSSSWTPLMKQHIDQCAGKNERLVFARQFGYGVPDLNRALSSAQNDLFMISQSAIQPFFKEISEKDGRTVVSAPKLYEMHMYDLPWPVQSLQELAAQDVELKITLSYFVEPNLGDKTSVLPPKYRSCGLRFHLKRPGDTDPQFLSRLNEIARQEEENTLPAEDDPDWHFGPKSIAAGSLHCDIWTGPAATLALRDKIAVVPVGGWWKEKVRERRFESSLRYSLIVSITSPDRQVELHTEVAQVIESRTIAVDISTPENQS